MKKDPNKTKMIYKYNDKKSIFVFFSIIILIIIFMIRELTNNNIKNFFICILSIFFLFVPFYIEKKLKIKLPTILEITFFIFIFLSGILGEVNDFYELIPFWDDILHLIQGFFVASIGISLVQLLNRKVNNKLLVLLFSLSLSITLGVVWEILEYKIDNTFKTDMQKDQYVYDITSILLNPKKDNNVMVIEKINYTIIYDKNKDELVVINGYLDIGLHDTMDDLIDTFIGALVFSVIGYLYLGDKGKYKFIDKIIIKG